ncbi:hypothetical protein WJX81_001137 [Elliptochloris bilobata]|uniref:Deacetylase sirtuin-type domain-containing protein n=1 Tax=Elliptochloris bilobata TaxID=381761 RepID=A0AAW1RU40_9CHLO
MHGLFCRHVHASLYEKFCQDRIRSDGSLSPGGLRLGERPAPAAAAGRSAAADVAPPAPPVSAAQLEQLVDFVHSSRRLLVLTGAGCSTESNLPDYRSPSGAYSRGFKPMTHQLFMSGPAAQSRYWSRSFAGWHQFSGVQPNAAHEALARLQRGNWAAGGFITQNVDRLHQKAGAAGVLEIHGTTHEVICMGCGEVTPREPFQTRLADLNPEAAAAVALAAVSSDDAGRLVDPGEDGGLQAARNPDGDVEVSRQPDGDLELPGGGEGFVVPPCERCGGVLKPNVVFFGDAIPPARAKLALAAAEACDALLVVGSSLMVWSAFRLAKAASGARARVAIVTAGPTRADDLAEFKIEARAGEVLARLAAQPELGLPRL